MRLEQTPQGWSAEWPDVRIRLDIRGDPRIADRDGTLVVEGSFTAEVDLDPRTSSRLVNGYQSWDYAGIRPADEAGHTWWGGAVADRASGAGLAFHALTAHRLATWFRTEPRTDGVRIAPRQGGAAYLRPNPPGWGFFADEGEPGDEHEPLVFAAAADARDALQTVAATAGESMRARRWDGPPICGWESWYHHGFSITPETLLANARLLVERFPEPFRLVQLDDGWQRAYGDWAPHGPWPDDLGRVVGSLRDLGCRAGLWLAPFMVWPGHGPDEAWLIRAPDGDGPLVDPLMGRHAIDASHPDALQWLEDLGARVAGWGFAMVKLDFLYLGAQEGGRHRPSTTGTEALRAGLAAFVDGLGPDVYVLGCGMPMLPAAGLCHGNRIGGDLAAPLEWPFPDLVPFDPDDGWAGILPQARNVAARWWTHRRLFDNDPDVVMAAGPDEGPPYTVEEARVLVTVAARCGGPYFMADDLAALPPAKRSVLEDPELLRLAWNEGVRPERPFAHVDTAPGADFFTLPTDLPTRWDGHVFDWAARRVRKADEQH